MGNAFSSVSTGRCDTGNVTSESETMNADSSRDTDCNTGVDEQFYDATSDDDARAKAKEEEMIQFKKQLEIKREQRREILNRHRAEKEELEKSLQEAVTSKLKLYEDNKKLRELLIANDIEIPGALDNSADTSAVTDAINKMREELDKMKSNNNKLRRDLAESSSALQEAYSDIADLNTQNSECFKQINALKEVVSVSKTMIKLREGQLNELKNKLNEIERSLSDREANMLSADLRQEYTRQLQNIRTLRGLYEERARLAEVTRQGLRRELDEQKALYQAEIIKSKNLAEKISDLEEKVEELQDIIENKNNAISVSQGETNKMKAEMAVVNKLFSQVLLGYKTKSDLDKLVHRLEENHGILTHMAEKENDFEASSALPKLLLELVSQIDEGEEEAKLTNEIVKSAEPASDETTAATPEEIVENLPKVWRVLMELLSHQAVPEDPEEKVKTCYKLVETKSGPVQVPSVSQTYIRLKDLIVEKLGLVKEVNRMKQLNSHLENRLQEQEKRLCLVTTELSKTWHVVGKLRRHHFQLHTHEKILKYELQQKRKLLNEIKEELEYCREKWEQAREKNTQSEKDWKNLRAEFSSRKHKSGSPSFNNSGESGYSDERPSDESSESNDESEYVAEPPIRCKKKMKKSFETIPDSSNDFNLAAEREDPVSDMLDVADLSLDTQDTNENHESSGDCSKSEYIVKSENYTETEDELCDIAPDELCIEDHNSEHQILDQVTEIERDFGRAVEEPVPGTSSSEILPFIKQTPIFSDEKIKTEMLASKEAKVESLELSGATLAKNISKISHEIDNTLDEQRLSNDTVVKTSNNTRPTISNDTNTKMKVFDDFKDQEDQDINTLDLKFEPENNSSTTLKDVQVEKVAKNDDKLNSSDQKCCEIFQELTSEPTQSPEMDSENQNNTPCTNEAIETSTSAPITVHLNNQGEISTNTINDNYKAIIDDVRHQNERLAKKDERLNSLEKECSEIVQYISNTINTGQAMAEKLDTLHNTHGITEKESLTNDDSTTLCNEVNVTTKEIDFKAILENVRLQNERLDKKDERLNNLEKECSDVVQLFSNTINSGQEMAEKLDALHDSHDKMEKNSPIDNVCCSSNDENLVEPSTSSQVNHEARFAARDLRLKRLEEQTKSLVKKVNKTTTKGVKINYKLEELHNIYGSENSRAGTPLEDIDEQSGSEDNESNNDEFDS